uniref:Uncharacterized protein n=1 Tax=Cacopsylla melanoneura TaxID=428564 RepID=A0A8D8ZV74_9HEMI
MVLLNLSVIKTMVWTTIFVPVWWAQGNLINKFHGRFKCCTEIIFLFLLMTLVRTFCCIVIVFIFFVTIFKTIIVFTITAYHITIILIIVPDQDHIIRIKEFVQCFVKLHVVFLLLFLH